MKFILIVTDSEDRDKYFGPFDDGEKALEWGEERFDENYFLMSTTLYNPTIWSEIDSSLKKDKNK